MGLTIQSPSDISSERLGRAIELTSVLLYIIFSYSYTCFI
jgi:hypothetical protein